MKPSLGLKVSQNLALTPQLQQAIRLLQLSSLELEAEINTMLEENPFLEREEADATDEAGAGNAHSASELRASEAQQEREGMSEGTADAVGESAAMAEAVVPDDWDGDGGWDAEVIAAEWGEDTPGAGGAAGAEGDEPDLLNLHAAPTSLQDYLHAQTLGLRGTEADRAALYLLIESLNQDGYLEDSLPSLANSLAGEDDAELEEMLAQLQIALKLLHSLEPAGVGARDLAECLRLQLQRLPATPVRAAALRMSAHALDSLARRDVRTLMQVCAADEATVRAAMHVVMQLDPKPGRSFVEVERLIVVPDVLVSVKSARKGQQVQLLVQINPDVLPRLRVHQHYAALVKEGSAGAPMQQSLQEARWFIKNVQQRFDTLLRVSQAIVARQQNFFLHGDVGMKPLVLRAIADELGMHESTISRVTTGKYMATPHGTFELKYFFSATLGTTAGGNTSGTAVRALIKQLIDAEDKAEPLSDNAIADLLKKQGISCARRTVAKYREALRMAPAHLRKTL